MDWIDRYVRLWRDSMRLRDAYCSFCRKSNQVVGPLVEGFDSVYICSECAPLCQSIVEQEKRRRAPSGFASPDAATIRATLDRLLSGQEPAKAVLSEAATRRREGKGRVLLIGPSKSSAMVLAMAVSFALEAPFAAGDASGLAKTGEGNVFFHLLAAAGFDFELAQRGVVFLKGMEAPQAHVALCRLWQENAGQPVTGLTMPVDGILFVGGATFAELDEGIVRNAEQPITFESFQAMGARAEWVAAFSAIACVPPLSEESLSRIVHWVDFGRAKQSPA
jgi:hypothetical protein